MLGRADPVRVDRLHVARVGLATPAEEELLGGRLPLRDDVVRDRIGVPVREPRRARDDPHHLRGEPREVVARLLVGDLVQLAELPLPRQPRRLGLEVGRRVARQASRLVRLWLGHHGVEVVVDEQPPHVLVRVVADELLDVDRRGSGARPLRGRARRSRSRRRRRLRGQAGSRTSDAESTSTRSAVHR